MAPHALWLHGLRSLCQAYGRKAVRPVEVWPGTRQGMVTEVMLAADDVSIHALDTHRHYAPREQNAGAPRYPRRHTRLEGHLWFQRLIGMCAHPWQRKAQHDEVAARPQFDFKIVLRPNDETLDHVILPQVRHPGEGWRIGYMRHVLLR